MLALTAGGYPLVNPAVFHYGDDSVWLTTSRHAVKVALARKRPEVSFLVDGGARSILLEGEVEVYDPRSVPGIVAALGAGPALAFNMAGYALKNAAYIGGYLRDLARIPGEWWPHNRVLLRLRVTRSWGLGSMSPPPPGPAQVPGVPAAIRRSLSRVPVAYVCTIVDGTPLLAPGLWSGEGRISVVTGAAGFLGISKRAVGGVVVESHHPYRATRMIGAYLRGRLVADAEAKAEVSARYGMESPPSGLGLAFQATRVTWWRGFHLQTETV
jgi:hypothetical protein